MKEALKLALEALEANQPVNYCMNSNGERFPMMHEDPFRFDRNTKAITAIKEALAQPEQEPVAFICEFYADEGHPFVSFEPVTHGTNTPLYASPPQRKPLTDEEIGAILEDVNAYGTRLYTFALAIEAAHGIKETEK